MNFHSTITTNIPSLNLPLVIKFARHTLTGFFKNQEALRFLIVNWPPIVTEMSLSLQPYNNMKLWSNDSFKRSLVSIGT